MAKVEQMKKKRKLKRNNNVKPASKPIKESGDVDDFADMLDTMKDAVYDDGNNEDTDNDQPTTAAQPPKKKRRKPKGKQLSAMSFEASREFAATITTCSASEQADWLYNDYTKHADDSQSRLDRDQSGLLDTSITTLPQNYPIEQQLKEATGPNWRLELCSTVSGVNGSPKVLVVSPAAMGAVDFIKACPDVNKACKIAKLFSKHFKVPEQTQLLNTTPCCIGAGTPNRLCKLADEGALKLDHLKLVLLDVGLDAKQRTLLDIPEVRADVWLFFEKHLKSRVVGGKTKISLFKL